MSTSFLAPARYEADGFLLRPYQAGDGPALREATVSSYAHLRPWMVWASEKQTDEEAEAVVRRLAGGYYLNKDYTLGIWDGEVLLGGTGFHLRCGPIEWKASEIGMWIRASRSGEGLGSRVLGAMFDWGFDEWGWERLIWKCETSNLASARVAEKNGMTLEATHISDMLNVEGNRRDTLLYVKLRAQHQESR